MLVLTCHCTVGVGIPLAAAVKVMFPLPATDWFEGFFVITGAIPAEVMVVLELLFPELGSAMPEDTCAITVSEDPQVWGVMVAVSVSENPFPRLAMFQAPVPELNTPAVAVKLFIGSGKVLAT